MATPTPTLTASSSSRADGLPLPRPKGRGLVALTLLGADMLGLVLALGLGLWLREALGARIHWPLYRPLWPFVLLFPLFFALMGLYPGVGLDAVGELRRLTYATSAAFLTLASASFLFKVPGALYSRGAFLLAWMLALVLVPLARHGARGLLARKPWWGEAVVILGAGKTGALLARTLQSQPGLGLKPVAFLDDNPALHGHCVSGIPVLGPLEQAPSLVRQGIRYAVLAIPGLPASRLANILETHCRAFAQVLLVPDLFGAPSLWVTARDLGGVLGLEVPQKLLLPHYRVLKRALDVVLLVLTVPIWLPVLGLLALLVKVTSPGPAFFLQERLGRDKTRFRVYKFRTMYVDAEARLQRLLAEHPALREEYARYHKLRHDPRVTPLGRFLRRFSLDELPQIWNVFKGEMSLVGPRAYMPDELPDMQGLEEVILRVPPGMTGLWQVSGRNTLTFQDRLRLDVYYVRNWSPWLDVYILAKTVKVVLTGEGAY